MDKLGHLITGYISVALFSILMFLIFDWAFDLKSILIIAVLTYLFCLLPDIDHPISTITWHFIGVSIVGMVVGYFAPVGIDGNSLIIMSFILLVLTFVCAQFAGHRGPIHTVWAGALFAVPVYFIFYDWRLCLVAWVAFYSHLCADGYFFKV